MITADFIKKIDTARVRLSECRSTNEVEEVFKEFGILDYPSKITLLRRCMQIQKIRESTKSAADDETTYMADLAIFLTGKWRKDNLFKESILPNSDSNLSSNTADEQYKKEETPIGKENLCKVFNLTKEDHAFFEKFYENNILKRIQKKYLAQLISVIEDMIDEKLNKQFKDTQDNERIQTINRYKIILTEFKPESGWKINTVRSIYFSHCAVIFYDPTIDVKTIRVSIAHELNHLLSLYELIPGENTDKYADLFASCVSKGLT